MLQKKENNDKNGTVTSNSLTLEYLKGPRRSYCCPKGEMRARDFGWPSLPLTTTIFNLDLLDQRWPR